MLDQPNNNLMLHVDKLKLRPTSMTSTSVTTKISTEIYARLKRIVCTAMIMTGGFLLLIKMHCHLSHKSLRARAIDN